MRDAVLRELMIESAYELYIRKFQLSSATAWPNARNDWII